MRFEKSLGAMAGYLGANAPTRNTVSLEAGSFPAITLSRQVGARAMSVGELLRGRLARTQSTEAPPWTLWGKELMQRVLKESNLPEKLAKFFPEDGSKSWQEAVEEFVGLHPSSFEINRRCHETILNLCRLGHVIIVGRCGNLLAKDQPNALHVRLVGSLDRRVRYMADSRSWSKKEALAYVKREDAERRRYARENFNEPNLDDPTLYDLVLNTDDFDDASVAQMIEQAMVAKVERTLAASR